jgi:hypothetical protein
MKNLDRIRQLKKEQTCGVSEAMPLPPTLGTAPSIAATTKEAKKPNKEVPVVTFRCGHTKPLAHFQGGICAQCQNENRRKKNAAKGQKKEKVESGRLPDKSTFEVIYDADIQRWTGSLTIPGLEPLIDSAGGVFKLLSKLDEQYRKAAKVGQ